MSDMIRDWWSQIILAAGLIFNYGRQQQQHKRMKEDLASHLRKHTKEEFITLPQHDRLQEVCKNEWKTEFRHIRLEMSTEFKHVKDALIEIKTDIRNNNKDV